MARNEEKNSMYIFSLKTLYFHGVNLAKTASMKCLERHFIEPKTQCKNQQLTKHLKRENGDKFIYSLPHKELRSGY